MRARIAGLLCVFILLTGCSGSNTPIDQAIKLRNRIENSNGCAFSATVTADYGDKIYEFSMDCEIDPEGNLTFKVIKPDTIAGITGKISNAGGALTFDDQVLAFQTIADGLATPVTAPWILMKTLKSGYLKGCAETDAGYEISADDSYKDNALHLQIVLNEDLPVSAEIFWNDRRLITMRVEGFRFL